MKGTVLLFNTESDDGLINSTSDVRFKFSRKSWISDSVPNIGDRIDFVADGEFAKEICLDPDYFPQSAAGASSGQHTRQHPPVPLSRTLERLANPRALEDLTIPRDSNPPVPRTVVLEGDLPPSDATRAAIFFFGVCFVSALVIFQHIDDASPKYGGDGGWNHWAVPKYIVESNREVVIVACICYLVASLCMAICFYTIIFRIWKSIQPFGVRTSPVAAIGYSFVPLFNLYWVFHVYYVWALNFNSKVRKFHPLLPPISTVVALAAPIGTIFSLIISFVPGAVLWEHPSRTVGFPIYGLYSYVGLLFVLPFLSQADGRARYLLKASLAARDENPAR